MINLLKRFVRKFLFANFILILLFFPLNNAIASEVANWDEVASTINEKQFIDLNSIKYDKKGILSVLSKYSLINPDSQELVRNDIFRLEIDCKRRLFEKFYINDSLTTLADVNDSISSTLIKKTIIKSCSY